MGLEIVDSSVLLRGRNTHLCLECARAVAVRRRQRQCERSTDLLMEFELALNGRTEALADALDANAALLTARDPDTGFSCECYWLRDSPLLTRLECCIALQAVTASIRSKCYWRVARTAVRVQWAAKRFVVHLRPGQGDLTVRIGRRLISRGPRALQKL